MRGSPCSLPIFTCLPTPPGRFLPSVPTTQNKVPFVTQVTWVQVTRQLSYLNGLLYSSSGVVSGSQLDLGGPLRAWDLPARKAVCEFPVTAVANHHKLGGLKQQKFSPSSGSQESKFKVSWGCALFQGSRGGSFLASPSFWWLLVFLGLWLNHSSLLPSSHGLLTCLCHRSPSFFL